MRHLILVAAVATLLFSTGHLAQAADRRCEWDDQAEAFVCTIIRRAEPGGPATSVDIDGSGPLPMVWSRTLSNGLPGAPIDCFYEETVGGELNDVYGVGWAVFITNTDTGDVRLAGIVCEYPGEDPPQPPPPPPSVDLMVQDHREVFELDTGLSPPVERRGVSQLETWFWCDYDAPRDIALNLGGYDIEAVVEVVSVTWTIDGPDGSIERQSDDCGAAPSVTSNGDGAAASWIPNEPGDYGLQLTAAWAGTWSLAYDDPTFGAIDLGMFDLGSVAVAAPAFEYAVYEIQTVGVAP